MVNILLNISNFDEPWAYESMARYLHPDTKVLILPLSYDEGWITDREEWHERYGRGHEHYEEIVRPFRAFGIPDERIRWINYYEDDPISAAAKIAEADVLFFTGGLPDWMMQRLYDLDIQQAVRDFRGVIMGTSAGALIQLQEFHLTRDADYQFQYQYGLGLLEGFDIDVHYEENADHLYAIIRSLEDKGLPVVCYPNRGGLIVDHGQYQLLGGAFVVTVEDLDEIYRAYEESRNENYW